MPPAELSVEDRSLAEGAPRIKFACHASAGRLEEELGGELLQGFNQLTRSLADALVLLEETGAAPIAPDGLVAGNCSALVEVAVKAEDDKEAKSEEILLVSKSGKSAGKRPTKEDFVAVQSFDRDAWSCRFCPAGVGAKPTSDTAMHWACLMRAAKEFGWREKPLVALHGHALAEGNGLKKAEALSLPISNEETLFSTPEDVHALMGLFQRFAYPDHRVFIRRGHGFLILAASVSAAMEELEKLRSHFEAPERVEEPPQKQQKLS